MRSRASVRRDADRTAGATGRHTPQVRVVPGMHCTGGAASSCSHAAGARAAAEHPRARRRGGLIGRGGRSCIGADRRRARRARTRRSRPSSPFRIAFPPPLRQNPRDPGRRALRQRLRAEACIRRRGEAAHRPRGATAVHRGAQRRAGVTALSRASRGVAGHPAARASRRDRVRQHGAVRSRTRRPA